MDTVLVYENQDVFQRALQLSRVPRQGAVQQRHIGGSRRPCRDPGEASKKTVCSICGTSSGSHYDKKIHRIRDVDAGQMRIYLDFEYRRVACRPCGGVKQEAIPWMAKSSRHTQRLEDTIGHYCRSMTASDVAKLYHLSWDQVWRLDMAYMERLVAEHPPSKHLRAVGFDEVSVRKGQRYVIIGADLDQQRPIWVSEELGRSEEDMDKFYYGNGDVPHI